MGDGDRVEGFGATATENAPTGKVSKRAPMNSRTCKGAQITKREVMRTVDGDEESSDRILGYFRSHGGDWSRWKRGDWAVMADAITREEDRLEMLTDCESRRALRVALRDVRRALEVA